MKSGPSRKPLAERFWPKVDRRSSGECWPWIGAADDRGYGRITRPGRSTGVSPYFAHRVAFALHRGLDPEEITGVIRHTCDNPPCRNPAHLIIGDYVDNNRDTADRGRAHWQTASRDAAGRFLPGKES